MENTYLVRATQGAGQQAWPFAEGTQLKWRLVHKVYAAEILLRSSVQFFPVVFIFGGVNLLVYVKETKGLIIWEYNPRCNAQLWYL